MSIPPLDPRYEKGNKIEHYIEATKELFRIRKNFGEDSPQEEKHLDFLMDPLWYSLSEEEIEQANNLPVKEWEKEIQGIE